MAVAIEGVSEQIARARRGSRRADVEKDQEARFDAMESEEDLEVTLGEQEIDFSRLEKYLREGRRECSERRGGSPENELFREISGDLRRGSARIGGGSTFRQRVYRRRGSDACCSADRHRFVGT